MNNQTTDTKQVIFITGRFRSGTSFLWQLFNRLDGYCAWYEPLHPQLLSAIKYTEPKEDHVGISDYWQSYRLNPEFESTYSIKFATQKLYLEANDEYPELEAYIKQLIELSGSDVPVLQFNRVDFRLSWLKNKFPNAQIIHIERNPLQLYHSQRKHIDSKHRDAADYWDAYELLPWCYALIDHFPMLISMGHKHAFYAFYLIYQMSNKLAKQHADLSINLDVQVFQSDEFIEQLSNVISFSKEQRSAIKVMTHVPEMPVFDDQLSNELAQIMTDVDLKLTESGLMDHLGVLPLSEIKNQNQSYWQDQSDMTHSTADLLLNINQLNSELTRVLAENAALKSELSQIQQVNPDDIEKPNGGSDE